MTYVGKIKTSTTTNVKNRKDSNIIILKIALVSKFLYKYLEVLNTRRDNTTKVNNQAPKATIIKPHHIHQEQSGLLLRNNDCKNKTIMEKIITKLFQIQFLYFNSENPRAECIINDTKETNTVI